MDRGHASSPRPKVSRRFVRRSAFGAASLALAAGGIAVNLSILGNTGWGPGGLTLGAAGVAQADVAPAASDRTTTTATTPRRPSTTTASTSPSAAPTSTASRSRRPQAFTTPTVVTQPNDQPDGGSVGPGTTVTTRPTNRSTTTTAGARASGEAQTFSPAAGVRITATAYDDATLRVTVKFANGWSGDTNDRGDHVKLRFQNQHFVIEWKAWIEDGKIKRSYERTAIDD